MHALICTYSMISTYKYGTAQWLGPRSKLNPQILSQTAASVRTSPVINLVVLHSGWDHPKCFYKQKTEILWAKNVIFIK